MLFITIVACNNAEKKDDKTEVAPQTPADSLMADVMEGHNTGMAKMGKVSSLRNEVQKILDSIAKLPAKAQREAAPYKTKLNVLLEELKAANAGMEKWMDEFNYDSAKNNMEQRIKYLAEEKLKISSIKESMLNSLHKADSLLKAKF